MLVTLTLFSERKTSRPGGKHVTKHDISVTLTESLKWDINVKNTLQVVKCYFMKLDWYKQVYR